MKQNVFKKSVASLIMALILIVALLVGFTLTQKFDAEMVIWEKIDYLAISEKYEYTGMTMYAFDYSGSRFSKYKNLYIFINGAGGMGGASDENNVGYGGGSGGMAVAKVDKNNTIGLIVCIGQGGGSFEFDSPNYQYGDGYDTGVIAIKYAASWPIDIDGVMCKGGKAGSSIAPGKGGNTIAVSDYPKPYCELIYSQDGASGGEASNAFTVDLGFRKQYFIFRPAGTNLSGKGGGASVFHRGGDGGVVFQNGFNGSKGSGGGGASKGATQGGYGGDGYVEIYGSNM